MAAVPEKKEKNDMGLFYDSTYLLVILAALISMAVSARMNTIFSKYQTVRSYSGMTGREAAMRILHQAGIYDVTVRHVSGKLTDHYDPRTKTVNLSDAVYDSTSVAAIGVAAHECGHAVQHNTDYVPLKVRSAIVPAANLGSQLFWPLFLIGLIFSLPMLVKAGIWLFVLALAFQVVTLPVEFDASRRALKMLSEGRYGDRDGTRRSQESTLGCSHDIRGSGDRFSAAAAPAADFIRSI